MEEIVCSLLLTVWFDGFGILMVLEFQYIYANDCNILKKDYKFYKENFNN